MEEELQQFKISKVWNLVPKLIDRIIIDTKWVYKNKHDEQGTINKNKARMIVRRYNQEEGTDYDEIFSPVSRIKAIKILIAFYTYMGFKLFQMYVKSAFLNRNLKEEVYVKQPLGFEDANFPHHILKLDKALCRLK